MFFFLKKACTKVTYCVQREETCEALKGETAKMDPKKKLKS